MGNDLFIQVLLKDVFWAWDAQRQILSLKTDKKDIVIPQLFQSPFFFAPNTLTHQVTAHILLILPWLTMYLQKLFFLHFTIPPTFSSSRVSLP